MNIPPSTPHSSQPDQAYGWLSLAKTIWYFLKEERAKYVCWALTAFAAYFFFLVPSYVVGQVVELLASAQSPDGQRTLWWWLGSFTLSSVLVSWVRLTAKRECRVAAVNAGHAVRVRGFEYLCD